MITPPDAVAALRAARSADVNAIVAIFQSARAAGLPYLRVLHGPAEDHAYFGAHVAAGATTVAVTGADRPIGFLVLGRARVEHLYVEPAAWRRGVGSLLLRHAQNLRAGGLDLWVFQRNLAAIAFYEAHGFTVADATDGTDNDEHEPDALMVWFGASSP